MPALAIRPEEIAPRDWQAHYSDVRRRIEGAAHQPDASVLPEPLVGHMSESAADETFTIIADDPRDKAEEVRLRYFPDIVDDVARKHQVPTACLYGAGRTLPVVLARHEAFYQVAIERPDLSIIEIGRRMGKDHNTVSNGIKKHCRRNNLPHPHRSRSAA